MPKKPFRDRFREEFENLAIEAIELLGFLAILFLGDVVTGHFWGESEIIAGLTFKNLFDIGDAALVSCFVIRACLRLFGIMKEP